MLVPLIVRKPAHQFTGIVTELKAVFIDTAKQGLRWVLGGRVVRLHSTITTVFASTPAGQVKGGSSTRWPISFAARASTVRCYLEDNELQVRDATNYT